MPKFLGNNNVRLELVADMFHVFENVFETPIDGVETIDHLTPHKETASEKTD